MEKKQTAVEWLLQRFESGDMYNVEDVQFIKHQADKMHKEEMIEFAKGFWYYGNGSDAPPCYNEDVEKFYNKVYES